ncbi:hypothetical protein PVAND_003790 [Polypedilum vanderplanki]|uniref:Uncharacterized protein n=1 Tax=Polypedilum vanderplanki TaxID=319348 RepID=A0A9J6BVM2_POLVA|nr:hypothetical protein PVAND_003790 [Polypedilum vanderplanki]
MSQTLNIITKWKIQLESKDIRNNLFALLEIIKILNGEEVLNNRNYFCKKLIEAEICHFIPELLIYRRQNTIKLVNKIICHLSEYEEFFKYEFFKILRGYMRLINSFPLNEQENRLSYRNDIISTVSIITKRARLNGVNFNDKTKISGICLLLTAYSVCETDVSYILAFDYVDLILDIVSTVNFDERDKLYQYQKIIKMIQRINVNHDYLANEVCFLITSNVLSRMLQIVTITNQSREEKLIISILAEKFMDMIEFIVNTNISIFNYECFCNLFYYMLDSEKISNNIKLLILNRFFILNGEEIITETIKYELASFKTRVLFGEIMFYLTKIFHNNSDNDDKMFKELKSNFKNVAYYGDFNYQNHKVQTYEPDGNTITLQIIKCFIKLKWEKNVKGKGEMLSMLAYFLEIIKRRKIQFDNAVFAMLITLYTSNFVNISTENDNRLLKTSSSTILKYFKRFNVIIDLKFVQWWYQNSKNFSTAEYERIVLYFIRTSKRELNELTDDDLYIFDLKIIIQTFSELKSKATTINYCHNLAKIIAKFSIDSKNYRKLMKLYEDDLMCKRRIKSIDLLKIMSLNIAQLTNNLKKSTLSLARNIINKRGGSIFERSMAIHLSWTIAITLINNDTI